MKPTHSQGGTKKGSATDRRNFRTFLLVRQLAAKEIGQRIAQARKEAGAMTQEQLAELLNVSTRSVQDYEAGLTIPYKYFRALEEIFPDRTMGWFLHGDKPGAPTPPDGAFEELRAEIVLSREAEEERARRLEEFLQALLQRLGPREAEQVPPVGG